MSFLLVVSIGGVILLKNSIRQKPSPAEASESFAPPPLLTNLPAPETEVVSPDGKHHLKMVSRQTEGNKDWTITIDGVTVFVETLPVGTSISLPFNTFSPDNKYIFIKEEAGDIISFKVLKLGTLEDNKISIPEISAAFKEKYEEYVLTDVTGWAGNNLLLINTSKQEGGPGPSFWYSITTKNFTRLSTRFD